MPKILAIDDKKDNLISITALLIAMIPECEVITATSGLEGIKKARIHLPDTILLDIKMPGMDGYEVCEKLKNDNYTKHIPVIMISAILTESRDQVKGLDSGADAFLAKPIDEYVLTAQIKTALRVKKAEDMLRLQKNQLEEIVRDRTAELVQINQQLSLEIDENRRTQKENAALESQFLQAQKMESVGRLAGGVAHDYNNALSVIMGYTELSMIDADPAGPLYADLTEVLKAASRAKDITRQLLAFARKQTIAPVVLDLNQNIESMFKMLRRLIGEDIDLAWFPGKSLESVNMDPSQIDQILANLCVNARDAIKGVGKIIIKTSMKTLDKTYCAGHQGSVPGMFVLLTISDNGCGMNKEILKNIFEPFFTTKDKDKGTGLGLSTVYGIVKQNKGFIDVDSEPGKGTAVKIYLPRHDGKIINIQKEKTSQIPQGKGETVLVVEDDLSILKLTGKILKGMGYTILTSDSPAKALDMAKEYAGKIHLLISDVIMPEMNGSEMSERLKSLYPELKCMFMSGYTANAIVQHGVLNQGVHFIQKPFSKIDLAKAVRKALEE